MLKLIITITILLGYFEISSKTQVNGSIVKMSKGDKNIKSEFTCEMCISFANVTLSIFQEEFIWKTYFLLFYPSCYLIPFQNYREVRMKVKRFRGLSLQEFDGVIYS
ncbi:unnamed protein product [Heterobilharzia americana]|nr:unnamed protein product [Heterobilharzia americana]